MLLGNFEKLRMIAREVKKCKQYCLTPIMVTSTCYVLVAAVIALLESFRIFYYTVHRVMYFHNTNTLLLLLYMLLLY